MGALFMPEHSLYGGSGKKLQARLPTLRGGGEMA